MDRLWSPWRYQYVSRATPGDACIFCHKPAEQKDRENYVLYRGEHVFALLNLFPYTSGHLMIAPIRHVRDLSKLRPEEMQDILHHLGQTVGILKEVFCPNGFNVGMNLGRVSGAGIPHHLHFHVIPRWKGDTNFMPVLADVRIIPEHLQQTYRKLRLKFKKLGKGTRP